MIIVIKNLVNHLKIRNRFREKYIKSMSFKFNYKVLEMKFYFLIWTVLIANFLIICEKKKSRTLVKLF